MKYFHIFNEMGAHYRQLGMPQTVDGKPVDPSLFFKEQPLPYTELTVPIDVQGAFCHFTIAPLEIPVVSPACSAILQNFAPEALRFVPGTLSNGEPVKIVHVLSINDCIDHGRSHLTCYPSNYYNKDLANKPQYVIRLFVDPLKVAGRHCFRVKYYFSGLVISEELLAAFLASDINGFAITAEVS